MIVDGDIETFRIQSYKISRAYQLWLDDSSNKQNEAYIDKIFCIL